MNLKHNMSSAEKKWIGCGISILFSLKIHSNNNCFYIKSVLQLNVKIINWKMWYENYCDT